MENAPVAIAGHRLGVELEDLRAVLAGTVSHCLAHDAANAVGTDHDGCRERTLRGDHRHASGRLLDALDARAVDDPDPPSDGDLRQGIVELDPANDAADRSDLGAHLTFHSAKRDAVDADRGNIRPSVEVAEDLVAAPTERARAVFFTRVDPFFEDHDLARERWLRARDGERSRQARRTAADDDDLYALNLSKHPEAILRSFADE